MSLGSKIKELRNSNGMTQKELSEKLNILKQKYKVDIPEVGIIEVSLNEGN